MGLIDILNVAAALVCITGCGKGQVDVGPALGLAPSPEATATPDPTLLPSSLKIRTMTDLGLGGGPIAVAPNGDYVIAGGTSYGKASTVKTSPDGLVWTAQGDIPGDVGTLSTLNGSIYATVTSYFHTTGTSEYQTGIYRSQDNGRTFTQATYRDDYYVMLSSVFHGTKIAASLFHVPIMPGTSDGHGNWTGYMNGWIDFGWYDTSDNSIEVLGRMATTGDEPGTFPSEVFLYERPSDHALMAGVRWGEAPQIPYNKMKISKDGGLTWNTLGGPVWAGYAGNIAICQTADGKFWADGYQKQRAYVVNSAVWQFDPETGEILETSYPMGAAGSDSNAGNGGIVCQGNEIAAVLEQGPLMFLKLAQ